MNIAVARVSGDQGRMGVPGSYGPPCNEELLHNASTLLRNITSAFTKCDIFSPNWRRVVHIDMTGATAWCPSGLHNNSNDNQTACGSTHNGCTPLTFPTGLNFTHVCGRVRGYQSGVTRGYLTGHKISDHYADGVLISSGNYTTHLWTYAVGKNSKASPTDTGPCNKSRSGVIESYIPGFVGNHSSCEYGSTNGTTSIAWEDSLWVGNKCLTPFESTCPDWFYRQVNHTMDNTDIEVRWCAKFGAIYTDILEIWVL